MLEKDFQILGHFLEELKGDMSDWNKQTDNDHTKIYYRQEEGLPGITLYLEAVINAPLLNLFAVLGEVQLFKEWVPMLP